MDAGNININGTWIRSSFCGPQHNCVELSRTGAKSIIRDSKNAATVLTFDHERWSTFVHSYGTEF